MKYITRALEPVLSRQLHQAPVVVLTGARQTEKSTLVQPFPNAAGRRYRSLDDLQNLELAQEAPNALLAERAPITGARPRCLDLISATGEPRQVKRWILLSNGRTGFCRSRSRALVGHEGPTRDTSSHSSVSIPDAVASVSCCTLGQRPGSFPTTSSPFHCPFSCKNKTRHAIERTFITGQYLIESGRRESSWRFPPGHCASSTGPSLEKGHLRGIRSNKSPQPPFSKGGADWRMHETWNLSRVRGSGSRGRDPAPPASRKPELFCGTCNLEL